MIYGNFLPIHIWRVAIASNREAMLGQRMPFIVKILVTALGLFLFSQNYILITSVGTVGGTEEDMAISELAATGTIVESNVTTATATIAGSNATTVWPKPQQDELLCAENGPEGTVGREMLTQHLKVTSVDTKRSPRIFCAIYTYPGGINQSTAIRETWGARCDGYMAVSTYTDNTTDTIHLHHAGQPGSYSSIWNKVQAMLQYMHKLDGYDFFHICGDDTYLIVDNLRAFLGSLNVSITNTPLYIGGPINAFWRQKHTPAGFYYNGGGPGYTLNRAALDLYVANWNQSTCDPGLVRSEEDFYVGLCFWNLGIRSFQAIDRYLHFDPHFLADPRSSATSNNRLDKFYRQQYKWWKREFNYTLPQHGTKSISTQSIAFHLIKTPLLMRRIHSWLYPEYRKMACGGHDTAVT